MPLINVLTDVKVWVVLGIVFALTFGFGSPDAATILMFVLIAQMTVSLDGIKFSRRDFSEYGKDILYGVLSCYGINTLLTLATGLLFIDNTGLWYGWVMLSAVPAAVSVVAATLLMKGDVKLSVLSFTCTYVIALGLTPVMTHALIGDSVDPMEILRYIIMFVAVPFILSIPIGKLKLSRTPKVIFINIMMMLTIFIGLGTRREFVFGDPMVVLALVVACTFRIFVFSIILVLLMKRHGCRRDHSISYMTLATWRNSGLATSLTLAIIAPVYPEAVLPCVVSLVMEAAWFAMMNGLIDRIWPREREDMESSNPA